MDDGGLIRQQFQSTELRVSVGEDGADLPARDELYNDCKINEDLPLTNEREMTAVAVDFLVGGFLTSIFFERVIVIDLPFDESNCKLFDVQKPIVNAGIQNAIAAVYNYI